jgi:hypothetical protein
MMKRLLFLLLFPLILLGQGQNFPSGGGGGLTQVTTVPVSCTLTSAPVQLTVLPGGIYTCQNGIYVLDGQIGGAYLPTSFGVKANWQIESTGANFTVTNGSAIVTCTTCAFTAADTGKEMFFTTWDGSDVDYNAANAGPLTATTITYNTATQVTMSQNANLNSGTTNGNAGVLAWGNNDDPVANSPWSALEAVTYNGLNCQNFQFSGITNMEKAHFVTATCRGISGGTTASKYPGVTGFGVGAGARILLPPWFVTTGCTAADGQTCFGMGEWANVTFDTLGQAGNITKAVTILGAFNDGSYKDLAIWGGWATSTMFNASGGGSHITDDVTADGGGIACTISTFTRMGNMFCGNGKTGSAPSVNITGGPLRAEHLAFTMGANGIGVEVAGQDAFILDSDVLASPAISSACIHVGAGGKFYGLALNCTNAGQTTSVAIQAAGTGYAYCSDCTLGGGATGTAWSCAATATCEPGPTNIYNVNPVGTVGCSVNSASPAACAGNTQGAFVIPTTTTTYTVNTTAVTANSVVLITPRTYTGNLPGTPTCVVPTITAEPVISAIVAGTSFTIALTSTVGQTCWNYKILNN